MLYFRLDAKPANRLIEKLRQGLQWKSFLLIKHLNIKEKAKRLERKARPDAIKEVEGLKAKG